MADVFIIHAREDRDQAKRLAQALSRGGLDVRCDDEPPRSGQSFNASREAALEGARRILVLWSPSAVAWKRVEAEAVDAWHHNKLHSVRLAGDVPVPFNTGRAFNLAGWDGSAESPEIRRLVDDIRAAIRGPEQDETGGVAAATGEPRSEATGRRRILLTLAALAAPTVIALAGALALMQWHLPTRIEVDLLVDRVALTVAATAGSPALRGVDLIDGGHVRLVQVEGVESVRFDPGALEIADESRYDTGSGRFPEDAWRPLPVTGEMLLQRAAEAGGIDPSVILQSDDPRIPGTLEMVRAQPGTRVVMALDQSGDQSLLTLDLAAPGALVDLVFPASLLLFAESMTLAGPQTETEAANGLSLRAPRATNTLVSVLGSERGLVLQAEPADSADSLLGEASIPVSALDFTRQTVTGERSSTLIGGGELTYPDLPGKAALILEPNEFVGLGDQSLEKARIESIRVEEAGGRIGLRLILDADVSRVRIGTPEHPRDARLNGFDWLRHEQTLAALSAIAVWLFSTTLAGYKLWQTLRASGASS